MAKGSRYWANSYIVLANGKKIYLSNDIGEIEEKMKSKSRIIKVEISGLFGERIQINKKAIGYYGKV